MRRHAGLLAALLAVTGCGLDLTGLEDQPADAAADDGVAGDASPPTSQDATLDARQETGAVDASGGEGSAPGDGEAEAGPDAASGVDCPSGPCPSGAVCCASVEVGAYTPTFACAPASQCTNVFACTKGSDCPPAEYCCETYVTTGSAGTGGTCHVTSVSVSSDCTQQCSESLSCPGTSRFALCATKADCPATLANCCFPSSLGYCLSDTEAAQAQANGETCD